MWCRRTSSLECRPEDSPALTISSGTKVPVSVDLALLVGTGDAGKRLSSPCSIFRMEVSHHFIPPACNLNAFVVVVQKYVSIRGVRAAGGVGGAATRGVRVGDP